MKRTAALRVTGDICFYYSILCLFFAFQRWRLPMAGFVLACLAVAFFAVGLKSMPLRLLLSLLPGACFLFAELHWMLVFPCLAWLYFILYLSAGHFNIAIYDYRTAYRWMLLVSAFVIAIYAISAMLYSGKAVPLDSPVYLALFLLLGAIAMRNMQMGAKMDGRWHAANALTVVAVLLVAVGVSLLVYQLYLRSAPALVFLTAPLKRLLAWLFGRIRVKPAQEIPMATAPPETPPTILLPSGLPIIGSGKIMEEDNINVITHNDAADQALSIMTFLILGLLIFAAVWLIVKFALRGKDLTQEGFEYEHAGERFMPERRRRKARTETVHGSAQTVRKIYREYLDYLQENGLQRSAADTSAEILTESERISAEKTPEEEALRRVYLKARYSSGTVTDEDVAAARASLDAIRSRTKT